MSLLGKSKKVISGAMMSPFATPTLSAGLKAIGAGNAGLIGIPLLLAYAQIIKKQRMAKETAIALKQKRDLMKKRVGVAGGLMAPAIGYGVYDHNKQISPQPEGGLINKTVP